MQLWHCDFWILEIFSELTLTSDLLSYFQFPLRLLDWDLLLGPAAVPPGAAQAGRHAPPARRGVLCFVIYTL